MSAHGFAPGREPGRCARCGCAEAEAVHRASRHSFCRVCYAVIRPCGGSPDCIHVRYSLCLEHIRPPGSSAELPVNRG